MPTYEYEIIRSWLSKREGNTRVISQLAVDVLSKCITQGENIHFKGQINLICVSKLQKNTQKTKNKINRKISYSVTERFQQK